ncbi:MAG TPA: plasmid maintenance system killer protein [Lactobacillus sp.]|nr:plasmid maintenance system killer protein [Lactobacillus sp.]
MLTKKVIEFVQIRGETNKITRILSKRREVIKKYGAKVGMKVMQRISEFTAAESLQDISRLPPQRLHLLEGNLKGYWAVDVSPNWRLVFRGTTDNEIDTVEKNEVKIIWIKEIVDYHEHK